MTLSRVPDSRWREPIAAALRSLPERIRERLAHVQFVCCYPHHIEGPAERRVTTVVLPVPEHPAYIVHELGHALDFSIGRQHIAAPVTDYAKTNRAEAFAEAFVAWRWFYGDEATAKQDRETVALFERLAA